jgi:hypothetical protein
MTLNQIEGELSWIGKALGLIYALRWVKDLHINMTLIDGIGLGSGSVLHLEVSGSILTGVNLGGLI